MSLAHIQTASAELPKFCKDCIHVRHLSERFPQCAEPSALRIDLVFGPQTLSCSGLRDANGVCGPEARLFNPKSSPQSNATGVIVFSEPGSGKSKNASALLAHFKKERLIDPWSPGDPLPADALALTNTWVPGCIDYASITLEPSTLPAP